MAGEGPGIEQGEVGEEKLVLNNGFKFCLTSGEPHMGDIKHDLDRFHRSHFGKSVEPE